MYAVISDTHIEYLTTPRIDDSWLFSTGISHQLRDNLSVSLDYQYVRYLSTQPGNSLTRNLITLGAHYGF
jgi:opacity protein-like surface antigen